MHLRKLLSRKVNFRKYKIVEEIRMSKTHIELGIIIIVSNSHYKEHDYIH